MRPKLLVLDGPSRGKDVFVDQGEVAVGRSDSNDLCVPDLFMSRKHFAIIREGHYFVIRDVGSKHGTFVQGMRVEAWVLSDGDLIRAGLTSFEFRIGTERQDSRGAVGSLCSSGA